MTNQILQHLQGSKELELMNENGDLQKVLSKFKVSCWFGQLERKLIRYVESQS